MNVVGWYVGLGLRMGVWSISTRLKRDDIIVIQSAVEFLEKSDFIYNSWERQWHRTASAALMLRLNWVCNLKLSVSIC